MTRYLILAATFLSAFLLFVVQPLFAKYLLPFYGGTSSVWTISIFFYSTVLLLGYVYSALLTGWSGKLARTTHVLLLVAAGLLLWQRVATDGSGLLVDALAHSVPAIAVLQTLVFAVGLPVLLLASTSVFAQYLYARLTNKEPYALFALSNAGSLLGLAAYPLVFETTTTLDGQAAWWVGGFTIFIMLFVVAWWGVDRSATRELPALQKQGRLTQRSLILCFAAIPTFLLAASTEFLSKGIASFPLLWVIPLMLYLVSFILAFGTKQESRSLLSLEVLTGLLLVPTLALMPIMSESTAGYWVGLVFVLISFFLIALYFHKRVYQLRPRVADLGPFYVWLTFGGAIGSGVVGLLLPVVLSSQPELFFAFGGLLIYLVLYRFDLLRRWVSSFVLESAKVIFITFALVSMGLAVVNFGAITLATDRNFYGTLSVYEQEVAVNEQRVTVRTISNGSTIHGAQVQDTKYEFVPGSYYGKQSGIDIAIDHFVSDGISPRVGVIGLGAGMVGAYCDEISYLSYVEINPAVVSLAEEYFSYLDYCSGKVDVMVGDGRLLLEEQVRAEVEPYHVLMIDAFTDDAIPSHLLTVEAFADAYKPLLAPGGVLVVHISNRYLNLRPPIAGMAESAGWQTLLVEKESDTRDPLQTPSSWVLLAEPSTVSPLLGYLNINRYTGEVLFWSDQQNSVMSVLSWTGSGVRE